MCIPFSAALSLHSVFFAPAAFNTAEFISTHLKECLEFLQSVLKKGGPEKAGAYVAIGQVKFQVFPDPVI